MCMMGSPMLSTIDLSTSVSSPSMTRRAFLPSFCDISRTIRFIFWKVPETGTIRIDILISCSSSVSLRSWRADLVKLSSFKPRISGEEVTIDSVITISPTIAIRLSSLDRLTLIRLCLLVAVERFDAWLLLEEVGAERCAGAKDSACVSGSLVS